MNTKLKALLATGRISNLPTVWCNCLVASLVLFYSTPAVIELYFSPQTEYPGGVFYLVGLILVFSSSLLYVGGCFLGDAIDAKFDAKHKPDRPIPSGIISRKIISLAAWTMLFTGLLLPVIFHIIPNPVSSYLSSPTPNYSWQQMTAVPFLFLAIVLYSIFHKRYPVVGLPLIGLCRFFLVVFSASITVWLATRYILTEGNLETSITSPYFILPVIIYASAVCLYTICFASVARTESSDSPITWRNLLRYTMLALPLCLLFTNQRFQIETITALFIYAVWLTYAFTFLDTNKGNYVSKCLAGFCLLDACFVAQFGWSWVIACLILFVLALALQKIAPAT